MRQHAEDRVFSLIGEYKKKQTRGQSLKNSCWDNILERVPLVGIVGCMAKNYQDKIFDKEVVWDKTERIDESLTQKQRKREKR